MSVGTRFRADQLVVGAEQHLQRFEESVDAAKSDVFILSTFVASQSDEQGRDRRERIIRALEDACRPAVEPLVGSTVFSIGRDNTIWAMAVDLIPSHRTWRAGDAVTRSGGETSPNLPAG